MNPYFLQDFEIEPLKCFKPSAVRVDNISFQCVISLPAKQYCRGHFVNKFKAAFDNYNKDTAYLYVN